MSLKAPTVVIFDMDGTTVRHLNPFILSICEKYDDLAYRVTKFFGWIFCRRGRGPIIPEIDLERATRKPPRLPVHRVIHTLRRREVDQIVEPSPGVYSVLSLLKNYKIPLALVSNGLGKGYGHDILEKFGLEKFFCAKIFREDIKKSKPNPESLLLALRETGVKLRPDDVIWFIGDRHKDVSAALAAAPNLPCKIIPVAYGINAAAAVLEKGLNPEQIIMSYEDMHGKLAKLLRGTRARKGEEQDEKPDMPVPVTGFR